jgi:hypothetical protein
LAEVRRTKLSSLIDHPKQQVTLTKDREQDKGLYRLVGNRCVAAYAQVKDEGIEYLVKAIGVASYSSPSISSSRGWSVRNVLQRSMKSLKTIGFCPCKTSS